MSQPCDFKRAHPSALTSLAAPLIFFVSVAGNHLLPVPLLHDPIDP
ncbi:hypothetical protein ACTVJH_09025 [Desulfoplanes sp. PS50]